MITFSIKFLQVILGASYGTPIDIWSAACIVFELLTGDQLFKPKESRHFGKDDGTH